MAKHIFVTGGVVSSLGKGITAASLGHLLKARGYHVTMQKIDPYLNVDPGTMSPFQHGEVFVTDDGHEGDLDLGHYERFIDESLTRDSNFTQGSIYQSLIARERRGDFLGGTVQVIPHVTNALKERLYRIASQTNADIVISEIGGTVGDIESQPFIEAARQFKKEKDSAELASIATRHQLAPAALQAFVDGILLRMIFDGEVLSDLMAPLELGWKARAQAETALMKELVPLLQKRAQGRDISGLSAYEQ